MSNYYIADLHFGHFNVMRFDNRNFGSIEEMEKKLIQNWNSVVSKSDTVYILGDFCWSKDDKEWIRILDLLTGSKVLIRGNHDLKKMSVELKKRFADIKDYKEITDNGKHIIMCHYPILLYKCAYNKDTYMLCGHIHVTREDKFLDKWRSELRESCIESGDNRGNVINVGCMKDYMGYKPRRLDEIVGLVNLDKFNG